MFSKTDARSINEIRTIGIDALAGALGPVDMARFLQSFDMVSGDYTKERAKWLDQSHEEILGEIKKEEKRVIDRLALESTKVLLPEVSSFVENGGATDQRAAIEKVMKGLAFLQGDVLGVLLYGSWATEESHEMSDIDICIVAPLAKDKTSFW